jgi:hypothetical protein
MKRTILIAAFTLILAAPDRIPAASTRRTTLDRVPVLAIYALPGYRARTFEKAVSSRWTFTDPSLPARTLIASGTGGPCASSLHASGDPLEQTESPAGAAAIWRIEGHLVSTGDEMAVFDVKWSRTVHHAGVAAGNLSRVERIELKDGAEGILDLVKAEPGAADVCGSFAIGVGMTLASAADLQDAGLHYDLWLVHRFGDWRQETVRAAASARQGDEATYVFNRLRFAADGAPANGSGPATEMNVSGTIVGRARKDGPIDLAVDTWRAFSIHQRTEGFGAGGRKRLIVGEGETVEFELPVEDNPRLPVSLKSHRTALRVTARRLW